MKKFTILLLQCFIFLVFICYRGEIVGAKEAVATKNTTDISGNTIGVISIYNNGEVSIEYKYGLRKADLFYCIKGEGCDSNTYSSINIMESSASDTYKNTSEELKKYTYNADLDKNNEYKLRVEVYFGRNSSYIGTENINSFYTICSVQTIDTGNVYLKGSDLKIVGDEGLNDMTNKIIDIVNSIIIPIIYSAIGLVFVVKGSILGVQIVKNADYPDIRMEKIHSLKWLIIGVAISFTASSVVGIITGFFNNLF